MFSLMFFMKYFALGIALLGIFILILLYWCLPVKEVNGLVELGGSLDNDKLAVNGLVVGERAIGNRKLWTLDNGLELVGEYDGNLNEKNISVTGLIDESDRKKHIEVLRLRVN